jgi:hypothetical protein
MQIGIWRFSFGHFDQGYTYGRWIQTVSKVRLQDQVSARTQTPNIGAIRVARLLDDFGTLNVDRRQLVRRDITAHFRLTIQ